MSTNCSGGRSSRSVSVSPMINILETGQADDVAGTGVLGLDLLQPLVGEKRGDVRPLAPSVAMNADDRIADRDAPADDPPKAIRPR